MVQLETWRPVIGYEDRYEISDIGRVRRSAPGRGTRPGRILKASISGNGYRAVTFRMPGVPGYKKLKIHALVAAAFIGPRPDGHVVRHLDGDDFNNLVENLAYGTPSENRFDSVRHGTDVNIRKTHCPRGHRLEEPNLRVRGLAEGRRLCLACHRASAHVSYHPELDLVEVAARYYAEILQNGHTRWL